MTKFSWLLQVVLLGMYKYEKRVLDGRRGMDGHLSVDERVSDCRRSISKEFQLVSNNGPTEPKVTYHFGGRRVTETHIVSKYV